jgi:acetyl esterase
MMIRMPLALTAMLVLPMAARAAYPPRLADAKEHVYKQAGETTLKLYEFSPAADKTAGPRPAIVFFFGGGWSAGTPEQFQQQARYFASRGAVALLADYRVRTRHGVPAVDCVRDAKSAVRWVRRHAVELGVDPQRIVAAGGSAGGHLAACTALLDEFDEPSEDAAVSSRPNALVLFNPALSFDPDLAKNDKRLAGFSRRLGVDPLRLSPAHHVDQDAPPTLILVGTDDFLIAGVRQFADRMNEVGARCELELYEDRTHGFFNHGRGGRQFPDATPDFLATTERADRFLASLGYLQGTSQVREFFDAIDAK